MNRREVIFTRKFQKMYQKANSKVQAAFDHRLNIFITSPVSTELHNHALIGKYQGLKSINITGDWRAIYSEDGNKDDVTVTTFHLLGTHSQLYK